jgi:aryl-alcohol dehydrogenase-like predicted oxidoreductase
VSQGGGAGPDFSALWPSPVVHSTKQELSFMHYRPLGSSGLKVSTLCLGTMMFGDRTDLPEARNIVASALAAGVNFIDTADAYTFGASEAMVGDAIRASRSQWVLATKVGNPMSKAPNERGYSRLWILRAIEASLKRLQTDYVDLYYLHRDIPEFALAQTLTTMGDLMRTGTILHFGVSNFLGWRIAEVVRVCDQLGVPRPVVCQPYYNALNRMPEVEVLPACAHYDIGVVPYSPIARGVLTGKYPPGQAPAEDTRAGRRDERMMETEFREESLVIAQKIKAHAEARGMTAGQFAYQWVLRNKIVSSVVAGPRTLAQWQEYVEGIDKKLDGADEALIDSLVKPGHASTHGYSDPKYPFFGRSV